MSRLQRRERTDNHAIVLSPIGKITVGDKGSKGRKFVFC